MTHKLSLLLLAAALVFQTSAQESITFIGQLKADSTFERAYVHVHINGQEGQRVHVGPLGKFRIILPAESEVELSIVSSTHLTERIVIDTHNAFCDPASKPINERMKMSFALFPKSVARGMNFDKPYATVRFVDGTGRRLIDHNVIEVYPRDMGDYADHIDR